LTHPLPGGPARLRPRMSRRPVAALFGLPRESATGPPMSVSAVRRASPVPHGSRPGRGPSPGRRGRGPSHWQPMLRAPISIGLLHCYTVAETDRSRPLSRAAPTPPIRLVPPWNRSSTELDQLRPMCPLTGSIPGASTLFGTPGGGSSHGSVIAFPVLRKGLRTGKVDSWRVHCLTCLNSSRFPLGVARRARTIEESAAASPGSFLALRRRCSSRPRSSAIPRYSTCQT
jgi:hypothetical protein